VRRAAALLLLAAWSTLACGGTSGGDGTYRCSDSALAPMFCIEYTRLEGRSLEDARGGCFKGVWAAGPCPNTGMLGGCALLPNDVDWYYVGGKFSTTAEVMNECVGIGASFVAPR
jgi:hypothetical protein